MVVVSQWPQKLWYQGRSGTVYPYQSHSNVSWCLIKTDSGYVYGVWCWPGASLRGQKLITHTRVLGPVVTIRLCVSRNIRQQQMWRAKYTKCGWGINWIMRRRDTWEWVPTGTSCEDDTLWPLRHWGTRHMSHVTSSRLLGVLTRHQWHQWPGPGCLGNSRTQMCRTRHESLNVYVNIFDILSKSPGFGDCGLGTWRGLTIISKPKTIGSW